MQVSRDGQFINIINLKPDKLKSIDGHDHSTHEVHEQAPTLDSTNKSDDSKKYVSIGKGCYNKQNEKIIESMLGREKSETPFEFKRVKSSSSCKVDDITSFVFGGFSSRFWLLRKHVNSMSLKELNGLPFYCWECITLYTNTHSINIVIKNQKQITQLLEFLVVCSRPLTATAAQPTSSSTTRSSRSRRMSAPPSSVRRCWRRPTFSCSTGSTS